MVVPVYHRSVSSAQTCVTKIAKQAQHLLNDDIHGVSPAEEVSAAAAPLSARALAVDPQTLATGTALRQQRANGLTKLDGGITGGALLPDVWQEALHAG